MIKIIRNILFNRILIHILDKSIRNINCFLIFLDLIELFSQIDILVRFDMIFMINC